MAPIAVLATGQRVQTDVFAWLLSRRGFITILLDSDILIPPWSPPGNQSMLLARTHHTGGYPVPLPITSANFQSKACSIMRLIEQDIAALTQS